MDRAEANADCRLPPGQIRTRKFPVVGETSPPPEALDLTSWRLEVGGLVASPASWSWSDFASLSWLERTVDIHCVTGWSRLGSMFRGVPLTAVLESSKPEVGARFVRFEAYSRRGHDTTLPLELALEDTWLVHEVDGEPLSPEHGFPLRTLTPSRYFYKSLKWLRRIELMADDRLGYWERESNYHNVGDPWTGDQRFTSGSLRPEDAHRFRRSRSFDRYRIQKRVFLGLDLRGWRPESKDLRELQLKNCDMRGADLRDADLRNANLSLSNLQGADLRDANAHGADLEGADLSGADLRGADLSETLLSATRFEGARTAGVRIRGATGLIGSQALFLPTDEEPEP
ncbi:MAG: molybdopterin-dependent oxidoreductase [Thermoanaerobaculia bacterium]|nr:molybdopterin-dependent oxidoreductase [Thermoanaerobaculia bacterium]